MNPTPPLETNMTESPPPLDAETLARNRQHFGGEPHFFWVSFSAKEEPQLLNVSQVWQASHDGKRPVSFQYAPIMARERRMLLFLAAMEGGVR